MPCECVACAGFVELEGCGAYASHVAFEYGGE